MASTGQRGELTFLGIRFGPMAKSLTAQKLLRKFVGGSGQTHLGITRVNPQLQVGGGGKNLPPDRFAAISERLGIKTNALVTFPKCVLAMKCHNPGKSITIHNSKMAASKPDIR